MKVDIKLTPKDELIRQIGMGLDLDASDVFSLLFRPNELDDDGYAARTFDKLLTDAIEVHVRSQFESNSDVVVLDFIGDATMSNERLIENGILAVVTQIVREELTGFAYKSYLQGAVALVMNSLADKDAVQTRHDLQVAAAALVVAARILTIERIGEMAPDAKPDDERECYMACDASTAPADPNWVSYFHGVK